MIEEITRLSNFEVISRESLIQHVETVTLEDEIGLIKEYAKDNLIIDVVNLHQSLVAQLKPLIRHNVSSWRP